MNWRRFVTRARISRVLLGLAALAVFKLALLGSLGLDLLRSDTARQMMDAVVESMALPEARAQDTGQDAAPDAAQEGAQEGAQDSAQDQAPATDVLAEPAPMPKDMDRADWAALKEREEELNAKERSLKALEATLDAKIKDMEDLQAELETMLQEARQIQDEKIKHLVDMYANMKAKQAATVLETLQPDLAVKILAGMKGRQAGEILSFVEPVKAAKLSEMLTRMQMPFDQQ